MAFHNRMFTCHCWQHYVLEGFSLQWPSLFHLYWTLKQLEKALLHLTVTQILLEGGITWVLLLFSEITPHVTWEMNQHSICERPAKCEQLGFKAAKPFWHALWKINRESALECSENTASFLMTVLFSYQPASPHPSPPGAAGTAAVPAGQAQEHLLWDKDPSLSEQNWCSTLSFLDTFYIVIRSERTPVMSPFANEPPSEGSLPRALNNLSYKGKTSLDLTPLRAFSVCVSAGGGTDGCG